MVAADNSERLHATVNSERLLVKVAEAAKMLSLSRRHALAAHQGRQAAGCAVRTSGAVRRCRLIEIPTKAPVARRPSHHWPVGLFMR